MIFLLNNYVNIYCKMQTRINCIFLQNNDRTIGNKMQSQKPCIHFVVFTTENIKKFYFQFIINQ